jgi:O-antigen ligase
MMLSTRHKNLLTTAAIYSATLSCLVLPLSTALLSLFSILTILFWLLSGKFLDTPHLIKNNPVVLVSTALFVLFIVGMTYSSAEIGESLSYLKKYRELLFPLIFVSLLQNNPKAQKNCLYSFMGGCIILLFISYGMYFSLLPSAKYGNSLIHHIAHGFFMAILCFWALHKAFDSRQYRYLWAVIFLLAAGNLLCISPGRTGMLVFFVLMILFLHQRLSKRFQLIGLLLLPLACVVLFNVSSNFSERTIAAYQEIQNYEYGGSRTSLGQRFDWWVDSGILIQEKPFFGHGTGAFTQEHDRLIEETDNKATGNPHNEYLLIGVQLGLVGALIFAALLVTQYVCSLQLQTAHRRFAQGVILAMIVGCLMNSFLLDSHQGHLWAFLSGICFASYPEKRSLKNMPRRIG